MKHTAPPVDLDRLVRHLIYGDIEEASLAILGEDCPSHEEYIALDVEQQTRLAAAATVAACLSGVLHPSGFILPNDQQPSNGCLHPPCSPHVTQRVAVLCVAGNSIYHRMPNVEAYDTKRDVRTFSGGMPVVGHPPCRSWSAYCAHQAKPLPGEKDLGPLVVEMLRKCGGVLEHPAHSRLFAHCDLPRPGEHKAGMWTAEVRQAWWGDSRTKKTWLCFFGIGPEAVTFPLRLHDASGDRRRWQVMSKHQRSATVPALAEWLVAVASKAKPLCSETNVSDQARRG